jgi:hypothetical protein
MNVRLYVKLFARLGFALGLLAALSCLSPAYLFYGMLCSILGTLISVAVLFVRTKHGARIKWHDVSILAILFASAPVIYVILLLFILRQP